MAIKKKSLTGATAAKQKPAGGINRGREGAKAAEPAKLAAARKLAMAKLATAKLSTARLTFLKPGE
ncbi:MAG TPA: hypothetical protein VMB49_14070 [Acidobacteriaceae bacterium]|nr:hypothetical protein [Acidobacteriaceae bacterium]